MMKNLFPFLLLTLSLAACRLAAVAQPTETTQAASPTFVLGAETVASGNYELTLSGEDMEPRDVIVHIPPAYDGSLKLPLLIVLHGGGGSAKQIQ